MDRRFFILILLLGFILLVFTFSCLVGMGRPAAQTAPATPIVSQKEVDDRIPLRVLIYSCPGAAEATELIQSLRQCNEQNLVPGYQFRINYKYFRNEDKLDEEDLKDIDVLVVPGGYLYLMYRYWEAQDVREWVRAGGGYVGICAGEILAVEGSYEDPFFGYYQGLQIAPHVERVNSQWVGPRNIFLTEQGARLLGYSGNQRMLVWNGSAFRYKALPQQGGLIMAEYASNLVDLRNLGSDNVEGVCVQDYPWDEGLENMAASIVDYFGRGTVVLCGPHPELPFSDYKYQKSRMVGAMIKIASGDFSAIPAVIGRQDILPQKMDSWFLSAMSVKVSAESKVDRLTIALATPQDSVGVLGLYSQEAEGIFKLAQTEVTVFPVGKRWHTVRLDKSHTVKKGQKIWLAWAFQSHGVLLTDVPRHRGDFGMTKVLTTGWELDDHNLLPAVFPEAARAEDRIVAFYATGY